MKRRQFLLSVPISYLAATNEVLATDNSIGNLEVQQDPVPLVLTSGPDYDKANFIGNELWAYKKPAFVVRAKTAADVAFAITLAKKHKIPFSVKGGGHSYAGYCLNQGGVMLDMSLMDQVEVDAKSMTVKIGGGTRWLAVYEALTKVNRDFIVMGGICPTVGVCGYIMGGGMNIASRSLGLGIDSLEALTIMTADGVIHELSSSQALSENLKDLWWAVRGGGGGNFGIVLSITLKIVILKIIVRI
jgi:FAD/FMN-containing dehydrogenase